jgi:hypothetical protein
LWVGVLLFDSLDGCLIRMCVGRKLVDFIGVGIGAFSLLLMFLPLTIVVKIGRRWKYVLQYEFFLRVEMETSRGGLLLNSCADQMKVVILHFTWKN